MAKDGNKKNWQFLVLALAIAGAVFLIIKMRGKTPPVFTGDDLKSFTPIAVDVSVLTQQKYRELRIFGVYPITAGVTGRKNPFVEPTGGEFGNAQIFMQHFR